MAETRETQVLEDVVESTEIENPRTTEEAILAQVIAGDEVTINARNRLQKYLSELSGLSKNTLIEGEWKTLATAFEGISGETSISDFCLELMTGQSSVIIEVTPFTEFSVLLYASPDFNGESININFIHISQFIEMYSVNYTDNGIEIHTYLNGNFDDPNDIQLYSELRSRVLIIKHPLRSGE